MAIHKASSGLLWLGLAVLPATLLAGCKVLTLEQDRALREGRSSSFDADKFVAGSWTTRIRPAIEAKAVEFAALDQALAGGLPRAGATLGRQAGEGSPWTFVVRGEGLVSAIDDKSRAGSIELQVATGSGSRTVQVQMGPVIIDTGVRDSVPFLSFDDFADQIAYANVGSALTRQALAGAKPALAGLKPGDRVRFLGAFSLAATDQPIRIVPIELSRV
ncbi:MAG: DUF2291 domain-containing protein [Novosphingobium sp.]